MLVWGQKGILGLVYDKGFPEEHHCRPSHDLMDRMPWNEEVGNLVFQFRVVQLDVSLASSLMIPI